MEISIMEKENLAKGHRIDADLYKPNYLNIVDKIKNNEYTYLGKELKLIKKGIFDIKADSYTDKGVPFVRISDLKDMIIDDNDIVHIPLEISEENKSTELIKNDIVLSKTARPAASLVNLDKCNVSQDIIAIKTKNNTKLNNHFLVIFLNTQYGLLQMKRWFTGNVQMHLNLSDTKNILIPIFSGKFQKMIKAIFKESLKLRVNSRREFGDAVELLKARTKIRYPVINKNSYTSEYEVVNREKRIDAEYYNPFYKNLIKSIKNYNNGYNELEELVDIKSKRFHPKNNVKYKYIELSNIDKYTGEIKGCSEQYGKDLPTRARRRVKSGDVIVSSVEGSLSRCGLITEEYDNAICSTGFHVLQPKKLNSSSILCLMKSFIGKKQLERGCTGTILTSITKNEITELILPDLEKQLQKEISEIINRVFDKKQLSKNLLNISKKGVEIAIENNEIDAINWIKNNLNKNNLNYESLLN